MIKQVIIIRNDLNMRKGKMIVQGCHASLGACRIDASKEHFDDFETWVNTGQTKIAVSCSSETELKALYQQAKDAKLPCSLIKDAGRTEFKEPTYTAVAIGPCKEEDVDKITRNLKLL